MSGHHIDAVVRKSRMLPAKKKRKNLSSSHTKPEKSKILHDPLYRKEGRGKKGVWGGNPIPAE